MKLMDDTEKILREGFITFLKEKEDKLLKRL